MTNEQQNDDNDESIEYLAGYLNKSTEFLNELKELQYIPYNSPNSLTVYSYKFYERERKLFLATKENILKEISFRKATTFCHQFQLDQNVDSSETIYSSTSSISMNAVAAAATAASQQTTTTNKETPAANKTATETASRNNNVTLTEEMTTTAMADMNGSDIEVSYLESCMKMHKFPRIKSKILFS